jgi:hypothetical protein
MDDPLSFDDLRARGLDALQRHAAALWSDYNVHDPGVTILEQVCFALTELGHRADFPVEDLLADGSGAVDLAALGLDPPETALPSRPVTPDDLAAAIEAACPAVRRVFLRPRGDAAERGLHDLFVAPESEALAADALREVRQAFEAARNLCEDINVLRVARPLRRRLVAEVEVRRRGASERLAAAIYERCRDLMDAPDATPSTEPLTPADACDAPEALFGSTADRNAIASIDRFQRAIAELEDVERVGALAFIAEDGAVDRFDSAPPFGCYRALSVPRDAEEVGLRLTSRGAALGFDVAGMRAELSRLRARGAMRGQRLRDETAWRPQPRGRSRDFHHTRLGDGFPRAFHVGPDAPSAALPDDARAAALQLRGFLALADAPLSDAAGDLAALPRLFGLSDDDGASYAARPFDFGPAPDLARGPAEAAVDAARERDPWRARKGRVLEYLLALRGEAFSQNSLRRFDVSRTAEARERRILTNRVRLLREIAALDRDRAAAPDRTAGALEHPSGAARKIAILLDFPDRRDVSLDAALTGLGLSLVERIAPDDPGRVPRAALHAPDPLAATPRLRDDHEAIDASALLRETAFAQGGALPLSAFRSAMQLDNYALIEEPSGWSVHLDDGDPETALRCATLPTRDDAERRANSLALLFDALNASTEGVTLVEDAALRGCVRGFAPMTLHVVFGGVCRRAADPGFRHLAEETARIATPAHLALRPRWLGAGELGRFDALHRAWRAATLRMVSGETGAADAAERAAAALARFLQTEAAP